jgi:Zn-dependent peptidase ImmA (M78 family)
MDDEMKALRVNVNPYILKWARFEAGYNIDYVVHKLKIDVDEFNNLEKTGKNIRYSDLEKMSKIYKRQPLIFFLKSENFDGEKTTLPTEYRNLDVNQNNFSPNLRLIIRRTKRCLKFYKENTPPDIINSEYSWLKNSQISPTSIREKLDLTVDKQRKNKRFSFYRELVEENLNIFVFQFPIKHKECDGFSYTKIGMPYAIVVNSRNSDTRKIFTLFHELAHIIDGSDSICIINSDAKSVEAKVNSFASDVLLPEKIVRPISSFNEAKTIANSLNVSVESYIIKAKILNRIKNLHEIEKEFLVYKENAEKDYRNKNKKNKQKEIKILSETRVRAQKGNKLFDSVMSKFYYNQIDYSTVRDILGYKVGYLL